MDASDGWKFFNIALAGVSGLGWFLAAHLWNSHYKLAQKVTDMQLHSVQVHVSRDEFKQLLREAIEPLNRKLGAVVEALEAQNIHVRHTN